MTKDQHSLDRFKRFFRTGNSIDCIIFEVMPFVFKIVHANIVHQLVHACPCSLDLLVYEGLIPLSKKIYGGMTVKMNFPNLKESVQSPLVTRTFSVGSHSKTPRSLSEEEMQKIWL
jgi:hypothetical protein